MAFDPVHLANLLRLKLRETPEDPAGRAQTGKIGQIGLSEEARVLLREHARVPELLERLDALRPSEGLARLRTDRETPVLRCMPAPDRELS